MKYQYYKLLYDNGEFPFQNNDENIIWHCSKEFAETAYNFFKEWAEKKRYKNIVTLQKITSSTGTEIIKEPDEIYDSIKFHAFWSKPNKQLLEAINNDTKRDKLIAATEQEIDKFLGKKLIFEIEESKQLKNNKIYKKEE